MTNSVKKSLIFLPGWGFKSSIWDATANLFTDYDVKTIDLPILNENHDLNQVINSLNKAIPENSILIAWSLSGLIAIYFCYYLPHKCAKLILVSSLPKFIAASDWFGIPLKIAERFQQLAKTNLESLLTRFMSLIQYPGSLHILSAHENNFMLINYLNFMVNTDYCELFMNLNMPVYCLIGANDPIIPHNAITQLSALNNNISVNIISNAGHLPFLTHQEVFTQLLTGILHE